MLPAFNHPTHKGKFILFEKNGLRTYVRDDDSFGLVIEQRLPSGEKRRIRYGNDQAGYDLYIEVLRYLAASKQPFESFRLQPGRESKLLESAIRGKIEMANRSARPRAHQMDMDSHGIIFPVSLSTKEHGLMLSQDAQPPIFLSNELIRAVAKVIPRMYASNPYFHQIYAFYSSRTNQKRLKPLTFRPLAHAEEARWTQQRRKPASKIAPSKIMGRLHRGLKSRRQH